jgi:peptidyl-prolyl cis-trans isomerase A (cyclophilin A)
VLIRPLAAALLGFTATFAGGSQDPRILTNPASYTETAPETFKALLDTSKGIIVIRVTRAWAPRGADRFYNLVKGGFYNGCRFFRVIPKFAVQFGIHPIPEVNAAWSQTKLPSDRAWHSNSRGRVTFAQGESSLTRTTQIFINLGNNNRLDIDGFAPFGEVTSSLIIVEHLNSEYEETVDQTRLMREGEPFLGKYFPRLDFIRKATIEL